MLGHWQKGLFLLVFSCHWGCAPGGDEVSKPDLKQVGEGDATSQVWGEIPLDDQGRPVLKLAVFRLGYVDKPEVLFCLDALPSNYLLGSAICKGDPTQKIAITAENVDQSCEPLANDRIKTQTLPQLAGCANGTMVATYNQFDPPMLFAIRAMD